jgi:hypothetical protein
MDKKRKEYIQKLHANPFNAIELSEKESKKFEEACENISPFVAKAKQIGRLVTDKNIAYGDSFSKSGDILKAFYPDGIKPEQYDDMLAVVRVVDKLFRIATRKNAFGESPWMDVTGYGILGAVNDDKKSDTGK